MNRITKWLLAAAVTGTFLSGSNALAQRNYDPNSVETVEGTVLSVEKMASPAGRGYGVHLTLQTADHPTIDVHLGPGWYVDKQSPHIKAKDVVIVTGSRVTVNGKPAIIAAEVKKGADVLMLRDKNGVPAWRGAGRRDR